MSISISSTPTVNYSIYPSSKGGLTSKAVPKGRMTRDDLLTEAASRCTLTKAQLDEAGRALSSTVVDACQDSIEVPDFWDFKFAVSTGGHADSPTLLTTAKQLNVSISASLNKSGKGNFESDLNMQRVSINVTKEPQIGGIFGDPNQTRNHYVEEGLMFMEGRNIGLDPTDPDQFITLTSILTGLVVKVLKFGQIKKNKLTFSMPPGVTGEQRVNIWSMIGSSVRQGVYNSIITDAPIVLATKAVMAQSTPKPIPVPVLPPIAGN